MSNPAPGFARPTDKVITVTDAPGTVTVTANGITIARSSHAKILAETPYKPAYYIPFADIDFTQLEKTTHSTHCPYKGDASYWTVTPAGTTGSNAMWAYESPYDEMEKIRDHGAFYADRVTITAE